MKLWLIATSMLLLIAGCTSHREVILQNRLAKQRIAMQAKQAQIDALNEQLNTRIETRARAKTKRNAIPKAPKNNYKPKKVEDANYSSRYMYPAQAKQKPVKVAKTTPTIVAKKTINTSPSMDRTECVTMIGQDKFDKYTKMFGSEAASLKRCKMLKAMQ